MKKLHKKPLKTIQTTIKDVAKAMKVGVADYWLRGCLIADGWPVKRADLILRWARMFNNKTLGEQVPYPDTTVITVEPEPIT